MRKRVESGQNELFKENCWLHECLNWSGLRLERSDWTSDLDSSGSFQWRCLDFFLFLGSVYDDILLCSSFTASTNSLLKIPAFFLFEVIKFLNFGL